MRSRTPVPAEFNATRLWLVVGSVCAAALVLAAALRYPVAPAGQPIEIVAAGGAIGLLLLLGLWVGVWGLRPRVAALAATQLGVRGGVVFGALWVIEITYNNVIRAPVAIRDPVDNVFWGVIALGMLGLGTAAAWRERSAWAGVRAGCWSGLVSGLLACLAALVVVNFGMGLLLADPANLAEWAARGPASGFARMDAYFAYQTMAGALLHLVLLGIIMGTLLGAVGGLMGRLLGRARPVERPAT